MTDGRLLSALDNAVRDGVLTVSARENIRRWLTESRYGEYRDEVARRILAANWQELDDAFWTVIPFGTGGRRGRMHPVGSNAINDRTIGESAQGLADYIRTQPDTGPLSCAIAYDTRHNSRHFAELCAGIMVAAGFRVYFLDDYRATPQLSYLVRLKNCSCGIMVTASHNPPSDNAVKVYWSTGGQVLPPHDKAIIDRVMNVERIERVGFTEAVADGRVIICTGELDAAFAAELVRQQLPGPRALKVVYSPLHGVGAAAVMPALASDGFKDVELFAPHAQPDGDFPNVPGHVSNPENPRVFDAMIAHAQQTAAELVMATDPDCDRLGCAAPLTLDPRGPWGTFTGNQIGALLVDYVLEQRAKAVPLRREQFVVKTLVTTELVRRIADSYGVTTCGNIHVGFKWIAQVVDERGPERFLFGTEESHGYMVGHYVRDKDGAVAAMLMAEFAASAKSQGKSLHQKLDALYWQHGYHAEHTLNLTMEGSQGMARMQALMELLRTDPPKSLGGISVAQCRDYKSLRTRRGSETMVLDAPAADMVILDLAEDGNYVAVRPSGTEPKVKFYMFTFVAAELLANLERAREEMRQRMENIEKDLRQIAERV
ncbi:MAG: phospho-sugar mutase [Planctomycetes bacterium]|nr:phospho-sugar mutase [Planctomycetota bacterium]